MNNSVINVKIKKTDEFSYPIFIGENILQSVNEIIKKYTKANKFLIVTNQKIYDLHFSKLNIEPARVFLIPDGEEYKNFDTYNSILNKCFELGLERKDAIIAFGGGVIGDIVGFVASTYLRGIDYIQIPTTLLAQVDSSIGGKVAINNQFGKNLVGAFYQPKVVIADISVLKTLDERQLKTGLAEVIKYGFIEKSCKCDENFKFLDFLKKNKDKIFNQDSQIMQKLVEICCELKASVVFHDEKEQDLRQILNFGHTFAHALEKLTDYKIYTHGEAVACGMKFIFNKALNEDKIDKKYYNYTIELLNDYKLLQIENMDKFSQDEILSAMKYDKKVKDGKIKFVIPTDFAQVQIL